jgi:sortase B
MKAKRLTIQVLSLLVFIGCVLYVVSYFYGVRNNKDEVSQIRDIVQEQVDVDTVEVPDENGENREEEILTYMDNGMISKYYPLYQSNNDMVGWLKVGGTNIDYPVMYTNDGNDYYLKHGFDKEKNSSGMLFLDYECSFNDSDNLIVYGHNMRAGTMFAELLKYKDKSFFNENGYVTFDSLYNTGSYRVIGAMYVKKSANFKYYQFTKAQTKDEFDEYVKKVKRLSLYETGETAEYGDKLLTLSTCSYNTSDEKFVVVAKKIG